MEDLYVLAIGRTMIELSIKCEQLNQALKQAQAQAQAQEPPKEV